MNIIHRIVLITLICLFNSNVFAIEKQKVEKFISIADIHFDPFLECEKSSKTCPLIKKLKTENYQDWEQVFEKNSDHTVAKYGHDTNYFLLKSLLSSLQKVNQADHPKFVLILGDFLGHNFRDKYVRYSGDNTKSGYYAFVKKNLQFLTFEINKVFPTVDVYPVIGNNDSYTEDYGVVSNGPFFQETKTVWSKLIKNKMNQDCFRRDFDTSGYYSVTLPGHSNQKIILLDTVLFSPKAKGSNIKQAAQQQLQWLRNHLSEAQKKHQKVILGYHIPVDINVSGAFKENFGVIWKFWEPGYRKEFKKISKQYSDTVTVLLPAHIHRDIFQFIMQGSFSKIPVNFTPSVSPIFGNDPGFKVFTYQSPSFSVTNVDTYFNDLTNDKEATWKVGYSVHVPPPVVVQEKTPE